MKSKQKFLDLLADKYNDKIYLKSDPIDFCYRYTNKEDIEVIGFISALFSYGNVLSIKKHLEILLGLFGKSPYTFLKEGKFSEIESKIPTSSFLYSKKRIQLRKLISFK